MLLLGLDWSELSLQCKEKCRDKYSCIRKTDIFMFQCSGSKNVSSRNGIGKICIICSIELVREWNDVCRNG